MWMGVESMYLIAAAIAVSVLNGSNNAANFVSIAMGSRALGFRRVLLYAALGGIIGAAVLAPRLYPRFLKPLQGVGTAEADKVLIGLLILVVWLIYASHLKAVAPVSTAILGILIGITSSGIAEYSLTILRYIGLWVIQTLLAALITAVLMALRRVLRGSLDILAIVLPAAVLSIAMVSAVGILIGAAITAVLLVEPISNMIRSRSTSVAFIAIPLTVASIAHGMNDTALLLGLISIAGALNPRLELFTPTSLGLAIACGVILWVKRVSEQLARSITLIDMPTATSIYISIFIVTVLYNTLGVPAPIAFTTLGSFIGVGMVKGMKFVNTRIALKLMAVAFATAVITSSSAMIAAALLSWGFTP